MEDKLVDWTFGCQTIIELTTYPSDYKVKPEVFQKRMGDTEAYIFSLAMKSGIADKYGMDEFLEFVDLIYRAYLCNHRKTTPTEALVNFAVDNYGVYCDSLRLLNDFYSNYDPNELIDELYDND